MSNILDWRWLPRGMLLGLLAFAIFGPLANLLLWAVAERWYFPHTLPLQYGFSFWANVFRLAAMRSHRSAQASLLQRLP